MPSTYQAAVAKTQAIVDWTCAILQLHSFCSMKKRMNSKPQNALTQVKLLPFTVSFNVIFHIVLPSVYIIFHDTTCQFNLLKT